MQVPEKLALIGGSILLSSTLIFTLKSQASQIIPHVGHSIGNVYQDITDTNAKHGVLSFDNAFKNAQKQGWTTGQWGTSKYYIDTNQNMHVGKGQLDKQIYDVLGNDEAHKVKTINLDQDIQAPQDSSSLFRGANYNINPDADANYSIQAIHGLEHLDTSQANNMSDMFYRDMNLSNDLNINGWDVQNVTQFTGTFGLTKLTHLDINNWHVQNAESMAFMFLDDSSLQNLDLSNWHTSSLNYADSMFAGSDHLQSLDIRNLDTFKMDHIDTILGGNQWQSTDSRINRIVLGDKTYLESDRGLSGNWQNGGQVLSSQGLVSSNPKNNNAHPGTWVKQ